MAESFPSYGSPKNIGFGHSFLEWIKAVLKNQESCVMNAGTTTANLKLQKGARHGDPISAYIFIFALEVLFYLIKASNKI